MNLFKHRATSLNEHGPPLTLKKHSIVLIMSQQNSVGGSGKSPETQPRQSEEPLLASSSSAALNSGQTGASSTTHDATGKATNKQPLMDDDDCTLFPDHLHIKSYYFPLGDKNIPYSHIERIETSVQAGIDDMGLKNWGMGLSDVWWSLDMTMRGPAVQLSGLEEGVVAVVVSVKGNLTRKGFTTRRWDEMKKIFKEIDALKGVVA